MSDGMQPRKCELCGRFFDVPLVRDNRGTFRARESGPWECAAPHLDPGLGWRLERARGYVRLSERTWVPGRGGAR